MPAREQKVAGLALLAGVPALALLTGRPAAALPALTAPSADPTAPLVAAASLAAWACTTWLLIVVLLTLGAQVNGPVGRSARRLATRVAPASVRALVQVAVGLTVTGSVLSGQAFAAEPTPAPPAISDTSDTSGASGTAAVGGQVPSLDWPTTSSGPTAPPAAAPPPAAAAPAASPDESASPGRSTSPDSTASPRPSATPGWTAFSGPTGFPGSTDLDATSRASEEVPAAGTVAGERPTLSRDAVPAPAAVVVQAGDSLWAIAARDLGASATPSRIARAWPQWWQANRAVLGDDPDLIHPGTSLTAP